MPLTNTRYMKSDVPFLLDGHKGNVLDFDWNPFYENIIASGGNDGTVKLWEIDQDPHPKATMSVDAHMKKVTVVRFNPVADMVLASGSADRTLKIWDLSAGVCRNEFTDGFDKMVEDADFNWDGSQLAVCCGTTKASILDPRAGKTTGLIPSAHTQRAMKCVWMGDTNLLCTTGFDKGGKRSIRVWDSRKLGGKRFSLRKSKAGCVCETTLDVGSGVIMPFFDPAHNVIIGAGKGDTSIRLFEFSEKKLFELTAYNKSQKPIKGIAMMPKRACDVSKNELFRMFKLHQDCIEPISFILSRTNDMFQADLHPDAYAGEPVFTPSQYFEGVPQIDVRAGPGSPRKVKTFTKKKPKMVSMDPSKRGAGATSGKKAVFKAPKTTEMWEKEVNELKDRIKKLETKLKSNNIKF